MVRASAKNNCTILLDLWPICGVAWKATYLDMQPSMRLADEPNPGAIWYNFFLPRPLLQIRQEAAGAGPCPGKIISWINAAFYTPGNQ
jgi:hypothetical protein